MPTMNETRVLKQARW